MSRALRERGECARSCVGDSSFKRLRLEAVLVQKKHGDLSTGCDDLRKLSLTGKLSDMGN